MAKWVDQTGLTRFWQKIKEKFVLKESGKGLSTNDFTAAYKSKLDGIATGANNYSHPTSAGNKHIPAGGASGQILRWSADGTAAWGADNNTTYSNFKGATSSAAGTSGLVIAPASGAANRYLRSDGTWAVPPDTNTTYNVATQTANGLQSAADKKKLDGISAGANNYTHPSVHPASMINVTIGSSTVALSDVLACAVFPIADDSNATTFGNITEWLAAGKPKL